MRLKLFTLSLIIPLLLPGCVENIISISIHPDGKSYFKFHSRGDSLDIFDNDFTHPTKTLYNKPQKELKEEGSNNWFQTTEVFLDDSMHIFQIAGTPSLGYRYDNHILVSFFKKEYDFRMVFDGRKVKSEYPNLFFTMMNAQSLDSAGWAPEAFTILMKKGLEDLREDGIIENDYIYSERLVNHVKNTFAKLEDEDVMEFIRGNKETMISELLKPFKIDQEFPKILSDAMEPHEEKLKGNLKLFDDRFTVKLLMPGQPLNTNATEIINDTLIWNFGIDSLLDEGYTLQANSIIYNFLPFQKLILTIITLLLFTFLMIRKFFYD
tara:strand:- start:235 stop:1203 length:969 start_codon:yes stop_codon:yes gene_type:complete